MSKTKPMEVADQKTADAFKALGIDAIVKGVSTSNDDTDSLKQEIADLKKSLSDKDLEIEGLKKGSAQGSETSDELTKAIDEKFVQLAIIEKSIYDGITELTKAVADNNAAFSERLDEIAADLEKIGSASAGRKTVAPGTKVLEKAYAVSEESGKKVLSKSKHVREITELLDGLSETKEGKALYTDATIRYEASRQLTKAVVTDLLENHDIEIVD